MANIGTSTFALVEDERRRGDAARRDAVRGGLDTILSASTFNIASLAPFFERRSLPLARALLAAIVQPPHTYRDVLECLSEPHADRVRPWRLACAFHVYNPVKDYTLPHVDEDDLRRIALHDRTRSEGARLVLACLGEVNWASAPRAMRAAYVLGVLCRLARGEGP